MNRREALARVVALTGSMVVGGEFFLTGCSPRTKGRAEPFTPQEIALMDEIAETIIPATDTPGAKAAGVGAFMAEMAPQMYDDANFAVFRKGLQEIEGKKFMTASAAERTAMLTELDRKAVEHARTKDADERQHYFRLMKQITLIGYFTSEIGATQARRYAAVPGAYDGNVPYKKGDRAWTSATHRFN